MRNIPLALRLAAHSYDQPSAWLMLISLDLGDGNIVRVVNNTEDIIFQGETYYAWAVKLGDVTEQNTGEIPQVKLMVGNTGQILTRYIDIYGGGVGSKCYLTIVNADALAENYSDLTLCLNILSCQDDAQYVNFTMGIPSPLRSRFPRYRHFANHCRYVSEFKGLYCKYSGTETACDGTYDRCLELDNATRFGGFIGLSGTVRVVA
jgi:phage-related protein